MAEVIVSMASCQIAGQRGGAGGRGGAKAGSTTPFVVFAALGPSRRDGFQALVLCSCCSVLHH